MTKKFRDGIHELNTALRGWTARGGYLSTVLWDKNDETWTKVTDQTMSKAKRLADFISFFTQLGVANLAFHYWLAKHDASIAGLVRAAYGIGCLSAAGVYLALLFRIQAVIMVYYERCVPHLKWIWLKIAFLALSAAQVLLIVYAINDFVFAFVHSSNLLKP